VKLTNGDVFVAREPLQKLLGEKFPVKVAYGLAKLSSKLNDQLKVIDDVRNGLVKTHGETDDKGQLAVKQGGANWEKFVEEFNELMAQEVTIAFDKVKLPENVASTCDQCHHNMDKAFEIEPMILIQLEKFLEVV